jgi:hypothetical protein
MSCEKTDTVKNENLYIEVIKNYIIEDSLYRTENISTRLLPYFYFPSQYSEDGLELPSPPISYDGEYIDESKLIERMGKQTYFSEKDKDHLKYQLIMSKNISKSNKDVKISKDNTVKKEDLETIWYSFYVPLFNIDSSAVYVQNDFYDNGYGDGSGALLIKKDGQWKLVDWFSRWTR